MGDGTVGIDRRTPVRVSKGGYVGKAYLGDIPATRVVQIAAGANHSMAMTADRQIYSWGSGSSGELGDGSIVDRLLPVRVLTCEAALIDTRLPIELTSFTGQAHEDAVELQWRTASELNSQGFFVERAIADRAGDVGPWQGIGFVDGHGTTGEPHQYRFTDEIEMLYRSMFYQIDEDVALYYRLKHLDLDGKFLYSDPIRVALIGSDLTVAQTVGLRPRLDQNYPNPFQESTTIDYRITEQAAVKLELYDLQGRNLRTLVDAEQSPGLYHVRLDATGLAPGTYYYKLTVGSYIKLRRMVLS
jgi:hypothetical protein